MVQVLPYVPTFGDRLREMASIAQDQYYAGKEQQKKREAFATFTNPNASDAQKLNAFMVGGGSLSDWLKYKQQQESSAAINRYQTLTGAKGKVPTGGGNVQVSDQDVGGQANEQAIADIQPGPESGSPTAPSQIIKAEKPNVEPQQLNDEDIDEEALDAAIADIARFNPQHASVLQKQASTRRKEKIDNQKAIDHSFEITQPFRSGVKAEYESALASDRIIDRMLEIAPDQESTPAFVAFMQKFGVPTGVFGNPTEQEIDKLSNELLKNIPSAWKGKILASEFHALLRTVPTLLNDEEGKKLIIRNMKLIVDASKLKYQVMREMTKEYVDANKKLPPDFEERITDAMEGPMKFLHNEFVKGSDEALSYAERLEKGGTSRYRSVEEEKIKNNPAIQANLKNLRPLPQGKVRYAWEDGKIFTFTPEEAAIALKKHPNLVRVQ